jgi:putative ABC transport system substrate-binding protein
MIVADPVGAKIIESYESSGRPHITGTRNRVPEEVQMKAIRAYRDFKRIGLIYNTNEQNSVLNVKTMRSVAKKMQFELVEAALDLNESGKPTLESIQRKIAELKEKNVDFIYVGSSSFLMAHRDQFTSTALEMGMPVAAAYEAMAAKSNALLAVASRYYNVGKLAGYQAEQILVEKIAPGDIPIRSLSRFSYVINMRTAKRLKLFPPLSVLRYAEVIEDTAAK